MKIISDLNIRERHLLARSLFRFNCFLSEEINEADEREDRKEAKKNIKIMQEVAALYEKLGLTNEDMYEVNFDGIKYHDRFKEDN